MLPEFLRRFCMGFSGKIDLVADAQGAEGRAQLFLAVGISPGGVEKADAAVKGPAQEMDGVLLADSLHRQRSEAVALAGDARFAQCDGCHKQISFFVPIICAFRAL